MPGYQTYLKCQVLPHLGGRAMSSLRRSDINTFVGMLVNKGLAPRTVRHIYALLAMMPRSAVYDRLLTATPCYKSTSQPSAVQAVDPDARAGHALLRDARPDHYAILASAPGPACAKARSSAQRLADRAELRPLRAWQGLVDHERVTKRLDLLVVADPESMSRKAATARSFGTRILADAAF